MRVEVTWRDEERSHTNDFGIDQESQEVAIVLGLGIIEEAPVFCDTLRWAKEKTELQDGPTKMVCPLPISLPPCVTFIFKV